MKQFYLPVLYVSCSFSAHEVLAQVGIGTTAPDAQLDIRSTNQVTPANTDGILIPKVDAFLPPTQLRPNKACLFI
jgi:hypothetical protein